MIVACFTYASRGLKAFKFQFN